jgi:multimeric flavodoxin WrbA
VARVLLVSGSTRSGSINIATLRTLKAVAPEAVSVSLYEEGMANLPAFNPDDDFDPLHPAVADLRQEIARSDAVVFCTPEYAGGSLAVSRTSSTGRSAVGSSIADQPPGSTWARRAGGPMPRPL